MRKTIYFLVLTFFIGSILHAQVKIGDNPQTLSNSSILELESTDKALVITRLTTNQMQALTALPGALVFNTDEGCVFHFNGNTWIDLCANTTNIALSIEGNSLVLTDSDGTAVTVDLGEAINQTFTNNPIENFRETIIITQDGSNYNFEVGEISGENIADNTIQGIDLASASITQDKLAPLSVGQLNLQENAVSDFQMDYSQVTLSDFINDASFITANQVLSPEPNNALIDNNGVFYDNSIILNDIAQNNQNLADHITADGDLDATNEIQDAAGVAVIAAGNLNSDNVQLALEELQSDVDNLNGGSSNTDQQNISTNNAPGNITIDNGNTININVNDGDFDDQNEIQDADAVAIHAITGIAGGNVQLALEELQVNVESLNAGGGNTDEQTLTTDGNPGNISISNGGPAITLNIEDGDSNDTNEIQDASGVEIAPITGINGANVQLALEELQVDVDGLVAGGGADGNDFVTGGILNIESLELTGTGGAGASIDLTAFALDTDLLGFITTEADGDPTNEIQNITSVDNSVTINQTGNDFDLSVSGGTPDGNDFITGGTVSGESLELTGTGAASASVDLSDFALDTDIFSLPDDSAATNGDVLVTDGVGNFSWATVAGGGTDTNNFITAGTLNAESLELTGNGGGSGAIVDLSDFALETEVVSAIAAAAIVDTDDQNDAEVLLATPNDFDGDTVDETTVQAALNAIAAISSDDQNDAEVNLATPTDFDGDTVDETTVQGALNAISAISSDDQNDAEVLLATPIDYDGDATDETTVQQALNAIVAISSDNQNDAEVNLATPTDFDGDTVDETTVQGALNAIAAIGSDDQNANEVPVTATPNNYSAVSPDVEAHLAGIDNALSDNTVTGTVGSVFFADTDGTATENNPQLFWDNTNNVLGIGTDTPDTSGNIRVQVSGSTRTGGLINSNGSATTPSYRFNDDPNTGMYWGGAADELAFSVGGVEALRIRDEGTTDSELVISGSLELTEQLVDETGAIGNVGDVLTATATGTEWRTPQIVAMGKYIPGGPNNPQGASVSGSNGNYVVSLNNPIPSAAYIIQLTVEAEHLINFSNQTSNSFEVIITRIDGNAISSPLPEWFFTISNF